MIIDPRVPVGSMWRVKHDTFVYSRPLSRWRAGAEQLSPNSLEEGKLITVLGVEKSESADSDPTERHQVYVAVLTPALCYVNRLHFNSDSETLERVT